jgi:hypothetical protein
MVQSLACWDGPDLERHIEHHTSGLVSYLEAHWRGWFSVSAELARTAKSLFERRGKVRQIDAIFVFNQAEGVTQMKAVKGHLCPPSLE